MGRERKRKGTRNETQTQTKKKKNRKEVTLRKKIRLTHRNKTRGRNWEGDKIHNKRKKQKGGREKDIDKTEKEAKIDKEQETIHPN